jgi:hypothetical protein
MAIQYTRRSRQPWPRMWPSVTYSNAGLFSAICPNPLQLPASLPAPSHRPERKPRYHFDFWAPLLRRRLNRNASSGCMRTQHANASTSGDFRIECRGAGRTHGGVRRLTEKALKSIALVLSSSLGTPVTTSWIGSWPSSEVAQDAKEKAAQCELSGFSIIFRAVSRFFSDLGLLS